MSNDIHSPFGTYRLTGGRGAALRLTQSMPVGPVGRRLALWVRKIVLWSWPHAIIDAVVDGLRWRIYVKDNVSERKFLFMPQFFDTIERALLRVCLKPGDIFVDIGANAGTYTVMAAACVGAGGRVLAFEPNPQVMERLHTNLFLNNLRNQVIMLPFGVADQAGHFDLHLDESNLGGSSLSGTGRTVLRIECNTLMHYLATHRIDRIKALKIDIEGAEDRALIPFLEQAPETLLPQYMIIENSVSQWSGDVLGALARRGYHKAAVQGKMNLILERHGTRGHNS
jgi:FkbM family methyltransferase